VDQGDQVHAHVRELQRQREELQRRCQERKQRRTLGLVVLVVVAGLGAGVLGIGYVLLRL